MNNILTWSYRGKTAVERFWKKVDKNGPNGCWLWTGSKNKGGYGMLTAGGQHFIASRLSWIIIRGPIPYGLYVLHDCPGGDNPSCVNPDHCFLGTYRDNLHDAIKKGRWVAYHGSDIGTSKLTEAQVLEIRNLYATGKYTQKKLGEMFGVIENNIQQIIDGLSWKHVGGPIGVKMDPYRWIRGNNNKGAKLNEDSVKKIRQRWSEGKIGKEIAAEFGVHKSSVYGIISGKYWTHVI